LLHSISAQAILKIVIFETRSVEQIGYVSASLLACSDDGCVTVDRADHETPSGCLAVDQTTTRNSLLDRVHRSAKHLIVKRMFCF
jgi:hypothetical protein